jgi:hypothetical protein
MTIPEVGIAQKYLGRLVLLIFKSRRQFKLLVDVFIFEGKGNIKHRPAIRKTGDQTPPEGAEILKKIMSPFLGKATLQKVDKSPKCCWKSRFTIFLLCGIRLRNTSEKLDNLQGRQRLIEL